MVGAEFNGTTEREEADGSGARTVRVRSSVVRFVASRVNTCKLKSAIIMKGQNPRIFNAISAGYNTGMN